MKIQNTKNCASCGRPFEWRKKWEKNWDLVKFCGDSCRKQKLTSVDLKIEEALLSLLDKRSRGSSICPSEVARELFPENWEQSMERVRRAVRRLAVAQKVSVTQQNVPVRDLNFKGPIRVKKPN
jgi:hypothetical protein